MTSKEDEETHSLMLDVADAKQILVVMGPLVIAMAVANPLVLFANSLPDTIRAIVTGIFFLLTDQVARTPRPSGRG